MTDRYTVLSALTSVLAFLILYIWSAYNRLIRLRLQVKTDYSDIDIQLKRRLSLIDNLVGMVKAYAKHEKETFTEVAKARSAIESSEGAEGKAEASDMLSRTLRSLFMVVEAYPQLKASENYKTLRDDLLQTENLIAGYREDYNRSVQDYNTAIQMFPALLVASLFGFGEEEFFKSSETTNVQG